MWCPLIRIESGKFIEIRDWHLLLWNAQATNRLTQVTGGVSATFSYDPSGNQTSGRGVSVLTYDVRNLPLSMTTAQGTFRYRYDAAG